MRMCYINSLLTLTLTSDHNQNKHTAVVKANIETLHMLPNCQGQVIQKHTEMSSLKIITTEKVIIKILP